MSPSTQSSDFEITRVTEIVHVNSPTHFPTKLTQTNFPVWRTQVLSSLTGLGILGYIDGSINAPAQFMKEIVLNPAYISWNRQDKIISSAMLGSCDEAIQPLISTAATAKEMWDTIVTLFANQSRSHIMSLKSHLLNNPCNSRTMSEYLRDIRTTTDDLALAGHPVPEDDLVLLTLAVLGDEYKTIRDAIKVREAPMSFGALHEQLIDQERGLKTKVSEPVVVTANYTQKSNNDQKGILPNPSQNRHTYNWHGQSSNRNYGNQYQRASRGGHSNRYPWPSNAPGQRQKFCNFCQRPNHTTKECRQLSRFLKENEIPTSGASLNHTMVPSQAPQQWLFDSGASHHITNNPNNLTSFSEYGGPDEILIGNGTTLPISHTGNSKLHSQNNLFNLSNVLCVPSLNTNLVSVAKFCKTNKVSVEFFSSQLLVKDLNTGTVLLRGKNQNDVYYVPSLHLPQLNVTTLSSIQAWHSRLGHLAPPILKSMLLSNKLVTSFPSEPLFNCNACQCNKSKKLPFGVSSLSSTRPLELKIFASLDHSQFLEQGTARSNSF
ncbi:hypothetical protein DCAR_0414620 [Daucus carota subsp. sativus]|uniref:GAG-pre-integrase domain-containing protein n=1 Tax=Daucus carota subsp. sativus TaxID=79200 RepID=A0AAF0WT54_DAUCS|nr:hypothetical protein DCAR_0414620 [Daucus carota subsp. sativus]